MLGALLVSGLIGCPAKGQRQAPNRDHDRPERAQPGRLPSCDAVASVSKIAVYLESGSKRTFACAPDWPGYCRSGKGEDAALAALDAAAPRYAQVAEEARLTFPANPPGFEVLERLPGTATTDFGAPDRQASG